MIRISKSIITLGGIAVAASLLTLAVPRAAHAVVATLVQVANTPSSPVIAQGIGNQAAQIVQIECGYVPGTQAFNNCLAVPASGILPTTGIYVVPAGETLVVTAVDILSGSAAGSPCNSPALATLAAFVPAPDLPGESEEVYRKYWIVPAGAGMVHYTYPSGILLPPGATLEDVYNRTTECTLTLDMHGYLTAQ